LVFSHLAAVCVPAVCDDIVIDLVENGHGYRIRQPAATAASPPARVLPTEWLGSVAPSGFRRHRVARRRVLVLFRRSRKDPVRPEDVQENLPPAAPRAPGASCKPQATRSPGEER
jgi:hypothetical protein